MRCSESFKQTLPVEAFFSVKKCTVLPLSEKFDKDPGSHERANKLGVDYRCFIYNSGLASPELCMT
jgi:hypothetical protein